MRSVLLSALLLLGHSPISVACVLPSDSFVIYENGEPTTTPMGLMIESKKPNPGLDEELTAPWNSCPYRGCGKTRETVSASAKNADELVLCQMPGGKPFFDSQMWATNPGSPAEACNKSEWAENNGENNQKKWHCVARLYKKYAQEQAKICQRIVITLPAGKIGVVPYKKPNYPAGHMYMPGQGCGYDTRCLEIDVVKKTATACRPFEMKALFPDADLAK